MKRKKSVGVAASSTDAMSRDAGDSTPKESDTRKKRKANKARTLESTRGVEESRPAGAGTPSEAVEVDLTKLEKQLRQLDWFKSQLDQGVELSPSQSAKLATRTGIEAQILALRPKSLVNDVINTEAVEARRALKTWSDSAEKFLTTHQVVLSGSTWLAPLETLDDAEGVFGKPLIDIMRAQGFLAPTPIQAMVWPLALRGLDVVAVAMTGSGKTCGFLLPALVRFQKCGEGKKRKCIGPMKPSTLVLSPTRELAQQIAQEARKFSVATETSVVCIFGGSPWEEQALQCKARDGILVATPGRLLDFSLGEGFDPLVSLAVVNYLVLDEADRMLSMGFGPDISKIVAQCPSSAHSAPDSGAPLSCSSRQTLMFSATWPEELQCIATSFSRSDGVHLRIGHSTYGSEPAASVTQVVTVVKNPCQKLSLLKRLLEKELSLGESAIVFAKTKKTCDYIAQKLWDKSEDSNKGTWCRSTHSGKSQAERDEILGIFRTLTVDAASGRRGVLVATDVAARGLDIPGVALVVIFDFGGGLLGADSGVVSYTHRIGRTGRAGRTGKAFTFFTERDSGARQLVELLRKSGQNVPDSLLALSRREPSKSAASGAGVNAEGGDDAKPDQRALKIERQQRRRRASEIEAVPAAAAAAVRASPEPSKAIACRADEKGDRRKKRRV